MKKIDYKFNEYICPFCGTIEEIEFVEASSDAWEVVLDQICSRCDEPFDLETWQSLDDDYDETEFYYDDENDEEENFDGFFFEDEIINDGDDELYIEDENDEKDFEGE